jgi:D-alanyl-D-alanine carboxypeptidase
MFWKIILVLGILLLGTGYFFNFPKSFWALLKIAPQNISLEVPPALFAIPLENRAETSVPLPKKQVSDVFALPNAHAAYVMDASSEKVLYAARAHERRQIASLTKIMTALLLMESGKSLSDVIVVDSESINRAGTTIGCGNSGSCSYNTLLPGEEVYLRDLLKAMLMNSANDSAVLIAKHVAGTEKNFVEQMNKRAKDMGLINTNFCTPNGLEPDAYETDCYSSAYDVAQIVAAALKYPVLWDTMRMENQTFFSVDGSRKHHIFNTNQLLGQYGRMLGAKTGFTPLAGYSLLSVGQEGEHQVIAVLLNDPVRWDDIRAVFDWAFTNFRWL